MARRRRPAGNRTRQAVPLERTIGDVVTSLIDDDGTTGKQWSKRPHKQFLVWPPDAFAVAATILRESGAYVQVVSAPGNGNSPKLTPRERRVLKQTARRWRERIASPNLLSLALACHRREHWEWKDYPPIPELPDGVRDLWITVWRHRTLALTQVLEHKKIWEALAQIVAVADEACCGMGVPFHDRQLTRREKKSELNLMRFELALLARQTPVGSAMRLQRGTKPDDGRDPRSSLCLEIDQTRAIVLPKSRVPPTGMTLRSLTHHLALLPSSEVSFQWNYFVERDRPHFEDRLNLVLFPWPLQMIPGQFRPVTTECDHERSPGKSDAEFGYFTFNPLELSVGEIDRVANVCAEANRCVGSIDGVIFPEMALDERSFDVIRERILIDPRFDVSLIVGGVYQLGDGEGPARNSAKVWLARSSGAKLESRLTGKRFAAIEFGQSKHHRWQLTPGQIHQYGIGASLPPTRRWWEYIELTKRHLRFFSLAPWLTVCVLICEDLARPDPVADAIRAVGPSLVIALLQDGPQLTSRWSARYATVLADDPGCSVLTLTGLGMSLLSRTPDNRPPSRVVALWKQADGLTREIELPPGHDALVLSLVRRPSDQWTADGRHDNGTGVVSLASVQPVGIR